MKCFLGLLPPEKQNAFVLCVCVYCRVGGCRLLKSKLDLERVHLLEVRGVFITLFVVMVPSVFAYVQTHPTVHI